MIFINGVKRICRNAVTLYKSDLFDGEWYLKQKPNLGNSRIPAFFHFVWNGCHGDPCRDFCAKEYLYLNPDVARARIPAVLHYIRFGKASGRHTSFRDLEKDVIFPEGTKEFTCSFGERNRKHKRVAIFASFSGNGTVASHNLHYLDGLRTCCDAVYFVSDNPLFEEEQKKLRNLVNGMIVSRHGEYDFGSYRRGWEWIMNNNILLEDDELLFCNDSCYGPFYPFEKVFAKMADRECDFWGLTTYNIRHKKSGRLRPHLQSFFLVFKNRVHTSGIFREFMMSIQKLPPPVRENVVERYEFEITNLLEDAGFTMDAYIPEEVSDRLAGLIYKGGTLIEKYNMPLLKVKPYFYIQQADKPKRIMRAAKKANPALHSEITETYLKRILFEKINGERATLESIDLHQHQKSFAEKLAKIRKRVQNREKIRVTFLVNSTSIFPSRPLLRAMENDDLFETTVRIFPGLKVINSIVDEIIQELKVSHPCSRILNAETPEALSKWHNISEDSDIVVYNTPYASSHPFYDPRFAYFCDFLPIHVNYGYYRSKYDIKLMKMDVYAYFWKVFFENTDILDLYKSCSEVGGTNGFVTGYCKMDDLANYKRSLEPGHRCLLIAPHHSIDGGLNRVLSLSNFLKYEDLFLTLPDLYPDIYFIFRPHPALFPVLSNPKIWGEEKVQEWKIRFLAHENVRWSDRGDYFQDFADSDAMLHDCGSFLPEYLYTGKPFCYMLKSEADIKSKFLDFGISCLQHGIIAYGKQDILSFIDEALVKGHDVHANQRKTFSENKVAINHPFASQKALTLIKDELSF